MALGCRAMSADGSKSPGNSTSPIGDVKQRHSDVEDTIHDHCRIRGWHLHAVNCRTNHAHVVVTAPDRDPEEVMDQFKAWCTRRLKEMLRSRGEPIREIGGRSVAANYRSTTKQASGPRSATCWKLNETRQRSTAVEIGGSKAVSCFTMGEIPAIRI
jgi:REP element-mobilizing transposase RayT